MLLYDAPVVGRTAVLLVVLPDEVDLVVVAAGLLWFAVWRDGVTVVLPVVDAACLLVEVLDGAVETRVAVALLLVAVVVLTLLTDWDAVVLLTLLLVPIMQIMLKKILDQPYYKANAGKNRKK